MEEFKELVGTIREMEESIRRCYAETIDLTSDSFVKMILVDVCFILELFFQRSLEMNDCETKGYCSDSY